MFAVLKFITSPIGWVLGGILAFTIYSAVIYKAGENNCRDKWDAANAIAERDKARLEQAALQEQARRTATTVRELELERAKSDERSTELQRALDEAEKASKAKGVAGNSPCRLDGDAIKRLR